MVCSLVMGLQSRVQPEEFVLASSSILVTIDSLYICICICICFCSIRPEEYLKFLKGTGVAYAPKLWGNALRLGMRDRAKHPSGMDNIAPLQAAAAAAGLPACGVGHGTQGR